MITVYEDGGYYKDGEFLPLLEGEACGFSPKMGREKTIAYGIMQAHNQSGNMAHLKIRFDAMASHDITYVGIIQTARASGLNEFPLPYVLTNCHNSLCAVGGTINEDDHVFGLSAAKKYGGEFVPAHQAVIHSYMRERYAGCGKMIIGSDSHTRYGAYGTMAIGEGGPELVKQLLNRSYDIDLPPVVGIYLTGKPRPGVGPQDVALALIEKTFQAGTVKNAVMEFFGPGIGNLAIDYRSGIDVMTTETSCLSSIWETDRTVQKSLEAHGRGGDYRELHPENGAFYDRVIHIALDKVECMIALPFHPSCAVPIHTFQENLEDLLHQVEERTRTQLELKAQPESLLKKIKNGKFYADQGVIAGCSGGTYQNLTRTAEILKWQTVGIRSVLVVGLSRIYACDDGTQQDRKPGKAYVQRGVHSICLLRSVLRGWRCTCQRRFFHSAFYQELSQSGGEQAGGWSAFLCGSYGCKVNCRLGSLRRRHYCGYRFAGSTCGS